MARAEWTNWYTAAYPTESVWALPVSNAASALLWCRTNTICYTNYLSATQAVVIRTNIVYDCRIDIPPGSPNTPQSRSWAVQGLTRYDTNGVSYLTGFTNLQWSTLTQLECQVQARDIWCIDAYRAWKERAAAADIEWWEPINNPIMGDPPLFLYTQNREHLDWVKGAILGLGEFYVNTNALGPLEQPTLTNVPMWTPTGMLAHVSAPPTYETATDWAMLNSASNGWRYVRALMGLLMVTKSEAVNYSQDWEIEWRIAPGIASNYPIGICDATTTCGGSSNDSPLYMKSDVSWSYEQQYASHPDPEWETLAWLIGMGIGVTNGELSFSQTEWRDNVIYWHADEYEDENIGVLSNYFPKAYAYQQRTLDEGHAGGYEAVAGFYPISAFKSTGYVWTADSSGTAHWNTNFPNYLQAKLMTDLSPAAPIECHDDWLRGLDSGLQEWEICFTNFYSGGFYEIGEYFNMTISPVTLWEWGTTNGFRYR